MSRIHYVFIMLMIPFNLCIQLQQRSLSKPIKKKILYWTPLTTAPPLGLLNFRGCPTKCVLNATANDTNFKNFDAIIFHGPDCLRHVNTYIHNVARLRTSKHNFIFLSAESAHNYPICDKSFDVFFNLTWTYKLNSDIPYKYFVIRDKKGAVIGPKQEMNWMRIENMKPISDALKKKLKWKFKVVAWMARIHKTYSKREEYVRKLNDALALYSLSVTVFGKRGLHCDYEKINKLTPSCWEMIETNYYFYLSFENSFSEDYVTEKVLNPLKHYTVPIVYGAANYTRFMPDGAYINAMEFTPIQLAKEINGILNDQERYYSFFKWHNHYSYHDPLESSDTNHLCMLCQKITDDDQTKKRVYKNFRRWWNEPGACN